MRLISLLTTLLFVLSSSSVLAQEDPPPPVPEEAADAVSDEAASASAAEQALYDEAFDALKEGDWAKGAVLLGTYLETWPKGVHRAEVVALRDLALHLDAKAVEPAAPKRRGPDRRGRTELVIFSSTFGLWLGLAGGILVELEEGLLLSSAVGGGGGLALSLVLSSEGEITEGGAALVSTVGTWATWNGLAFSLAGELDAKPTVGVTASIGALGVIVAAASMSALDPDPGDVSLVGSGGTWGTFLAGMGLLITQPDLDEQSILLTLVAGSDVGLLTMAVLTPQIDISRSRARFIDLGGLLGVLTIGGIALAADIDDPATLGVTLTLGAGAGIGTAIWLTDDWDKERNKKKAEAFELHTPTPFILPQRDKDGQTGFAAGLNLLQGEF